MNLDVLLCQIYVTKIQIAQILVKTVMAILYHLLDVKIANVNMELFYQERKQLYEGRSRSFAQLILEATYRGWGHIQNYNGNPYGLLQITIQERPPLIPPQASTEAESEVQKFTPTFGLWPKIVFYKKLWILEIFLEILFRSVFYIERKFYQNRTTFY